MSLIEIPMGWEEKTIESISTLVTKGSTPSTYGHSFTESGIPFLRAENVLDNKLSLDPIKYISKETHAFLKRSIIKPSDVLLTIAGTIGRSSSVPDDAEEMNSNQAVAIIRLTDECMPEYLSYFLNSRVAKEQIARSKMTGSISNLSLSEIKKIKIPLPKKQIQKQIIKKLADVLEPFEEKKKAILELQKQSLENVEKLRLQLFRHAVMKLIPYEKNNDLHIEKFSKVTKSFDGLRIPLNKSERSKIKGKYPYYGASGQVDSINDYKFDGRFLLIAEDGENLNTQKKPIAYLVKGKFWVNNHAHVVQTTAELDIEYLCYYLNGLNIMNYAKRQATRPKLRKSDLDSMTVIYPELLIQKTIISQIIKIKEKIENLTDHFTNIEQYHKKSKDNVESLTSTILAKAFSGKLVN